MVGKSRKEFEGLLITTNFLLVDHEYQYTSRNIKQMNMWQTHTYNI
jgi:hypothetical protein